jgi:uncharacterized membrane protein
MIFNLIWVFFGFLTVWILWNTLRRNYYESTGEEIISSKEYAGYMYFFLLAAPILIALGLYSLIMLVFTIFITGKKPCLLYVKKNTEQEL